MPPSPTVDDGAPRTQDPRWLLAALLAGGVLISGFTILQGIDPFDEGLALQAARRILAGQILYRDFRWAYGPAQPYILAGLFKLFGVSLLQWRILRALADGTVALLAYLIVRSRSGAPTRSRSSTPARSGAPTRSRSGTPARSGAPRPVALACWLAVACEMAQPRSANPFPYALAAVLAALWLAGTGEPPRASVRALLPLAVLTALGAAFRFDFAAYGLVAVTVVIAARAGVRPALLFAVGAAGLGALVYLPFAILDGPASLYNELIGVSLRTGAYWSLPFPWLYHAPAGAGIGRTIKHAIDFYVPLIAIAGVALLIALSASRSLRERRLPAIEAGLIVLGAGMLAYLLSRADEFHTQPLFVVAAIGLALCCAAPRARAPAAIALTLLGLLLVHGVGNRLSALARPPSEATLKLAVADGVMASPAREAAAIDAMVALVGARVPPGAPIYVLPRRSDLVTFADPLIYVLTERDNPSPVDYGLQTGAAAQAAIVRVLARVRPRVIVRWTDPLSSRPEPNLRGRSSGVHTVDRWIALNYRPLARLYHYVVLVPRR